MKAVMQSKNEVLAAVLALFFGPLGLLYTNVKWAAIAFVAFLPVVFVTLGMGFFIYNPVCAVVAYMKVKKDNAKLLAAATTPAQ